MLTPAFHFQILEQFIAVFHAKAEVLVSKLRAQSQVDVVPLITLCALDIICGSYSKKKKKKLDLM
jgi:hypothetical protein